MVMQKLYFENHIPQIQPTTEHRRQSNIAFITKVLQMCCWKNGMLLFDENRI